MLIINVKKSGSIDKALKKLKRKVKDTKQNKMLKERKEYKKPSLKKREKFLKVKRSNNFK